MIKRETWKRGKKISIWLVICPLSFITCQLAFYHQPLRFPFPFRDEENACFFPRYFFPFLFYQMLISPSNFQATEKERGTLIRRPNANDIWNFMNKRIENGVSGLLYLYYMMNMMASLTDQVICYLEYFQCVLVIYSRLDIFLLLFVLIIYLCIHGLSTENRRQTKQFLITSGKCVKRQR